MTHDEIWSVLQRHVLTVMSDLQESAIHRDQNLHDLGANSLDRMDILTGALDELRLSIPTQELAAAPDLGSLADLLHSRSAQP